MDFVSALQDAKEELGFSEKLYLICLQLYSSYEQAIMPHQPQRELFESIFSDLLSMVKQEIVHPFSFQPYHKKIRAPYDYYQFGLSFVRPLVDFKGSSILRPHNLNTITKQLENNENVILFSNHQSELDPQLISLMLENSHPKIAEEITCVAGDRVITDPVAIPFSKGRNLLCIYSKRHIANPPEKKHQKQLHNQKTMKLMKDLLVEGGKCIYVAPSGGRDRRDETGNVAISAFEPNNIEMFRLMAEQSGAPTHFYPFTLDTHAILPPPEEVESEIGEMRKVNYSPIHLSFGDEIDMQKLPGHDLTDRHAKRTLAANHIWELVKKDYKIIKESS